MDFRTTGGSASVHALRQPGQMLILRVPGEEPHPAISDLPLAEWHHFWRGLHSQLNLDSYWPSRERAEQPGRQVHHEAVLVTAPLELASMAQH